MYTPATTRLIAEKPVLLVTDTIISIYHPRRGICSVDFLKDSQHLEILPGRDGGWCLRLQVASEAVMCAMSSREYEELSQHMLSFSVLRYPPA